jgi:hypothetical protein
VPTHSVRRGSRPLRVLPLHSHNYPIRAVKEHGGPVVVFVTFPTCPLAMVRNSNVLTFPFLPTALPAPLSCCYHGLQLEQMRIQHLPPERVPRSGVFKGSFIPTPILRGPTPLFSLGQHYGPEVQKIVDTVDNDCFACRAAAARSPPR